MTYNYNQTRHLELLKRDQKLKNQGKYLLYENREEGLELSEYNSIVQGHIFWEDRNKIDLLLENFLTNKIDGQEMCDTVLGMRRNLRKECDKFILELLSNPEKIYKLEPNEKSTKLCEFFTALFCECEHFGEDFENDEFYTSMQNGYLNFQEAFMEK